MIMKIRDWPGPTEMGQEYWQVVSHPRPFSSFCSGGYCPRIHNRFPILSTGVFQNRNMLAMLLLICPALRSGGKSGSWRGVLVCDAGGISRRDKQTTQKEQSLKTHCWQGKSHNPHDAQVFEAIVREPLQNFSSLHPNSNPVLI
jgi:hypothetical protein